MADSFNLVASIPVFIRILAVFVYDGFESIGVVVEVFSLQLLFEVDGTGLFS